jgi:hypothetical protein
MADVEEEVDTRTDKQKAFDKKVALQKSVGVMPRVPKSLSEADLKLLYYTTATEDSYKTKAIPESMSFSDIHNIGKKDTKYFKYKPSTAPFWQRSMCRYVQDYIPLPLGDSVINKALAETFAPMKERKMSAPSFEKVTRYKDEFQSYPTYSGPPKPFKPSNPMHVDLKSQLLEKRCRTHEEYLPMNEHLHNPEEDTLRPSRWELRVQHPTLANTRYTEDFCNDRRMADKEGFFTIEDESFRTQPASIPSRVRKAVYLQHDGQWPKKGALNQHSVTNIMREPNEKKCLATSPPKSRPAPKGSASNKSSRK